MIRSNISPKESAPSAVDSVIEICTEPYSRSCFIGLLALAWIVFCISGQNALADSFEDSPPVWEPLLWGGKITATEDHDDLRESRKWRGGPQKKAKSVPKLTVTVGSIDEIGLPPVEQGRHAVLPVSIFEERLIPDYVSDGGSPVLVRLHVGFPRLHCREPFRNLSLRDIPPLYLYPPVKNEGMWEWKNMPVVADGWPTIYRTTYRPSVEYPNAVVHILLFDMQYVKMRLYIGSAEPYAPGDASMIEPENRSRLLAITNGLWKQKHAKESGAIFRGKVLSKMVPGLATIVIYKDDSVDVLEWKDGLPLSTIRDARQLKHLIVKDGKVVNWILVDGKRVDSEIGLGLLLSDYDPSPYYYWYGSHPYSPAATGTYGAYQWFIATRSAFGIREDGNLVFALGHHISTKGLAKAMVLAGCVRAIHGDANPHNVLGNLYYTNGDGVIVKKDKLSPDQKTHTLNRYVDQSYTSDFFAFYRRFDTKGF